MQKLDKKQLPQFVGLCVLSSGVFGYFALRMMTPSPASAATRPAPKPVVPTTGAAATAATATPSSDTSAVAVAVPDAPPPTTGMRDPFLVGYHDPKTAPAVPPAFTPPPSPGSPAPLSGSQAASAQIHEQISALPPAPVSGLTMPGFPAAPPLPSAAPALKPQKIIPLPLPPPAPPKWSVTGLVQSDNGGLAILRDGDSRRIVHVGDFVDAEFRVTAVTRSSVVLRHGKTFYTLVLGTKPEAKSPAPVAPAAMPAPESVPTPAAPPAPVLPRQSQAAPQSARHQMTAALAGRLPLHLLDGTEMSAGTALEENSGLKIASKTY